MREPTAMSKNEPANLEAWPEYVFDAEELVPLRGDGGFKGKMMGSATPVATQNRRLRANLRRCRVASVENQASF